jgi:hypothetical protein
VAQSKHDSIDFKASLIERDSLRDISYLELDLGHQDASISAIDVITTFQRLYDINTRGKLVEGFSMLFSQIISFSIKLRGK